MKPIFNMGMQQSALSRVVTSISRITARVVRSLARSNTNLPTPARINQAKMTAYCPLYRDECRNNPVCKGKFLSIGAQGSVYQDARNPEFVYKVTTDNNQEHILENECRCFRKYYGDNAAQLVRTRRGEILLWMKHLPGKPLSSFAPDEIKPYTRQFIAMVDRLDDLGILHSDFHTNNILFDIETKSFYPIDIHVTEVSDWVHTHQQVLQTHWFNETVDSILRDTDEKVYYRAKKIGLAYEIHLNHETRF